MFVFSIVDSRAGFSVLIVLSHLLPFLKQRDVSGLLKSFVVLLILLIDE